MLNEKVLENFLNLEIREFRDYHRVPYPVGEQLV